MFSWFEVAVSTDDTGPPQQSCSAARAAHDQNSSGSYKKFDTAKPAAGAKGSHPGAGLNLQPNAGKQRAWVPNGHSGARARRQQRSPQRPRMASTPGSFASFEGHCVPRIPFLHFRVGHQEPLNRSLSRRALGALGSSECQCSFQFNVHVYLVAQDRLLITQDLSL